MEGSAFAKGFAPTNQFGIDPALFSAIRLTIKKESSAEVDVTYTSASIAVDSNAGAIFNLALDGDAVIGAPLNASNGKKIMFRIRQNIGGNVVTWNEIFRFSLDLPSPTITVTQYFFDIIQFTYNEADLKWDCTGIIQGYDNSPV